MQGFAADPDYWKGEVFAYVGLPRNLKDLKHHHQGPRGQTPLGPVYELALRGGYYGLLAP